MFLSYSYPNTLQICSYLHMHPTSSSLSYQSHWIQMKFMLLKYFWAWTLSEAIPLKKKKRANPFPACAGLLYPAPPVHAAIVSGFILFRFYACSYNCCVFLSGSIYQWNYSLEFRKHSFLKVIYHFWFLYNLLGWSLNLGEMLAICVSHLGLSALQPLILCILTSGGGTYCFPKSHVTDVHLHQ